MKEAQIIEVTNDLRDALSSAPPEVSLSEEQREKMRQLIRGMVSEYTVAAAAPPRPMSRWAYILGGSSIGSAVGSGLGAIAAVIVGAPVVVGVAAIVGALVGAGIEGLETKRRKPEITPTERGSAAGV